MLNPHQSNSCRVIWDGSRQYYAHLVRTAVLSIRSSLGLLSMTVHLLCRDFVSFFQYIICFSAISFCYHILDVFTLLVDTTILGYPHLLAYLVLGYIVNSSLVVLWRFFFLLFFEILLLSHRPRISLEIHDWSCIFWWPSTSWLSHWSCCWGNLCLCPENYIICLYKESMIILEILTPNSPF